MHTLPQFISNLENSDKEIRNTDAKENLFSVQAQTENTLKSDSVRRVTRNLFDIEKVNITSEYVITPEKDNTVSDSLSGIGLSPCQNIKVYKRLCYLCINGFTDLNYGIRCQSCVRSYHVKCMTEHNIRIDGLSLKTFSHVIDLLRTRPIPNSRSKHKLRGSSHLRTTNVVPIGSLHWYRRFKSPKSRISNKKQYQL
nr:unnamed protein product [Callosobruchus analis]